MTEMNEPLTEAVGDTQMSHLANPAPTQVGATNQAWGAIDYPPTGSWNMRLASRMGETSWRRVARKVATRLLPTLAAAGAILAFALGGQTHTAAPKPTPAPTPYVPVWTGSTPEQQDAYIKMLESDGMVIDDRKAVIDNGDYYCRVMSIGQTLDQVIQMEDQQPIPGASSAQEEHDIHAIDITDAMKTMCPQFGS